MTRPRTFRDLVARSMTPAARGRAARHTSEILAEMPLQVLRRARDLSQAQLAEKLATTQPEISRMERRTDMYVSTLRDAIEAMGGQLAIVAHFPDGAVEINQFHDIDG